MHKLKTFNCFDMEKTIAQTNKAYTLELPTSQGVRKSLFHVCRVKQKLQSLFLLKVEIKCFVVISALFWSHQWISSIYVTGFMETVPNRTLEVMR